jgi:hypothetical protein
MPPLPKVPIYGVTWNVAVNADWSDATPTADTVA